jgi:hypothetical protein
MEKSFYNNWVESGKEYHPGVSYFNANCKDEVLQKLFSLGENSFSKKKLEEELKRLSEHKEPISLPSGFVSHTIPKKKIVVENLPADLQTEYMKLGPIIREISYLNSRLDVILNEEDRKICAHRIVELSHERRGIYNRLDDYQENGRTEPPKEATLAVDAEKELKRLRLINDRKLIASKRSKCKNKPNQIEKFTKLNAEIAAIDEQLELLK